MADRQAVPARGRTLSAAKADPRIAAGQEKSKSRPLDPTRDVLSDQTDKLTARLEAARRERDDLKVKLADMIKLSTKEFQKIADHTERLQGLRFERPGEMELRRSEEALAEVGRQLDAARMDLAAEQSRSSELHQQLANAHSERDSLLARISELESNGALQQRIDQLEAELDERRARIQSIYASGSWRHTRIFRRLAARFRSKDA
ncbi:hypothetical protein IP78_13820 [Brevundimonas sp. AAP58]|uniref:hypothetical protein n=1 Tax=Brevundimonas sp. AAP58 TaxID=1523422 RepID=UPI0006B98D9D|nr:hypothetical protein [Brevundimonas sp. AAP58]KPF75187.1 hypothetical protein IP78_13820 [Brevundimonas sp. AAP58]